MRCAQSVVRATTVFLVCAGGLTACGLTSKAQAPPRAPTIAAVVKARFAVAVDLDGGGLLVTPPPTRVSTAVSESQADAMFEAADAVQGPHAFAIFGLGVVTVAPRLELPTTTAPPATTTPPSTSTPAATATTTSTATSVSTSTTTTTTTTVSSSSTSVAPTTVAGASPPPTTLPRYHRRLAWVGIVWPAPQTCAGSATTRPTTDATSAYVAIIIDAQTGNRVLAYRSGGSSTCPGAPQTPTVTEPDELLSVPWQPVGPASTAVQIQVPACGRYYGWTQIPAAGGTVDDQVVVAVPFDPACGSSAAQSLEVDQVVPLGSGQGLVGHAAVGPVQALQALPND